MEEVILIIHLIIAIALIGVVLLQRSEGGALGIGSGSGGGGNLFTARGVGNALTRTTAYLAVAFFATSITLTILATRGGPGPSIFNTVPAQQGTSPAPTAPAQPQGDVLPKLPDSPQVPVSQ